jgi:hypothetical protein
MKGSGETDSNVNPDCDYSCDYSCYCDKGKTPQQVQSGILLLILSLTKKRSFNWRDRVLLGGIGQHLDETNSLIAFQRGTLSTDLPRQSPLTVSHSHRHVQLVLQLTTTIPAARRGWRAADFGFGEDRPWHWIDVLHTRQVSESLVDLKYQLLIEISLWVFNFVGIS